MNEYVFMDLAYKYELKLKKQNALKDQQTQNYKSGLKSNQETKIINKISTTWI